MQYEAIDKVERVLSQFRQGLSSTKVLQAMQAFPELFFKLFVYSGEPSADDVLKAIFVDEEETVQQEGDSLILAWTQQYVKECDGQGMSPIMRLHTCMVIQS